MPVSSVLSYAAAYFSLIVAIGVVVRDRQSLVHRIFAAGLGLLAVKRFCGDSAMAWLLPADVLYVHKRLLAVSSLVPVVWVAFSLAYASRRRNSLSHAGEGPASCLGVMLPAFALLYRNELFAGSLLLDDASRWILPMAMARSGLETRQLLASILVLFNPSARSDPRRPHAMADQVHGFGVGGLFALRVYLYSQELLFKRVDTDWVRCLR
jgi:hypothetical protein